jgi:hypothetical protein
MEEVRKLKEIGEIYEKLLNDILNKLFTIIPNCVALEIEDSLIPIYTSNVTKNKGIVAFPYKCEGKIGYIIISEKGEVIFEDTQGESKIVGTFK